MTINSKTDHSKEPASDPYNPRSNRDRKFFLLLLLFCLAGLGVAIKLTHIHYFTHTDPSFDSVCAISEEINCETVAQSPFSVFLALPVSVWGIMAYTLMSALLAWGIYTPLSPTWPRGIVTLLITAAFVASGILAYISFFLIDSLCLFCAALYGINLCLFILVIVFNAKSETGPIRSISQELKALFEHPLLTSALVLIAAIVLIGAQKFVPEYWHHLGWNDLPQLKSGVDKNGLHWLGATKPVLTVIEFSDYECPFCRRAHRNMRQMTSKYADEVRFIHRHYPIDPSCNDAINKPLHQRACEFAMAVECAAKQDKFWQMNDAVFSIQNTIDVADVNLSEIAVQLGLDRSSFKTCMKDKRVLRKIRKDIRAGRDLQVRGTPTFFIGNQPFSGGFSEDILFSRLKTAKQRKK